MSDSIIRHVKCGGKVFVDVSPMLRFSTPAMAFTPTGVVLPVLELQEKDKGRGVPEWYCRECDKTFQPSGSEKELEIRCLVCSEWKPVKKVFNCHQVPAICESCVSVLTGKSPPENPAQRKAVQFMSFGDSLKFVKFTEILSSVKF